MNLAYVLTYYLYEFGLFVAALLISAVPPCFQSVRHFMVEASQTGTFDLVKAVYS